MKSVGAPAVQSVLQQYFKSKGYARYTFSVREGFSYEGMDLYAYDVKNDYYFHQHIPPDVVAASSVEGFGRTIGKYVQRLRDMLDSHEAYLTRGVY